jgi:hypothetical protein
MKQLLISFLIYALSIASCSNNSTETNSNIDSTGNLTNSNFESVNVDTIKIDTFQKNDPISRKTIAEIDSLIEKINHSDSIVKKATKFIQLNENDSLIIIPDFKNPPEEFFASYSILTENDKFIFISESPYSNAGDWWEIRQYFFNENGSIRAFTLSYSVFDSRAEGGFLIEKLTCYFDFNTKLIKRKYQILDGKDKDLDFKKAEIIPTYYNADCPKSLNELIKEKPFLKRERWLTRAIK